MNDGAEMEQSSDEDTSWLEDFCKKLSPAEKKFLVDYLARAGVDEDESIHDEMIPIEKSTDNKPTGETMEEGDYA